MDEILEQLTAKVVELVNRGEAFLNDEEVQERIDLIKRKAKEVIRRYPAGSVVSAALIGYIIARLLTHKDED